MLKHRTPVLLLTLGLMVLALACGPRSDQPVDDTAAEGAAESAEPAVAEEEPATATAVLQGVEGSSISGTVTFTETAGGVEIAAHVTGIETAGLHGFHLHEVGDCSAPDFTSAGGHFNPGEVPHGGPDDPEHHAGDFGNVEVGEDGIGHLQLTSTILTVSPGPSSVVGRAVIFHEGEDDLVSQPTGAAGGRLACGVVQAEGEMGADMEGDMDEGGMEEGGEGGDEPVH